MKINAVLKTKGAKQRLNKTGPELKRKVMGALAFASSLTHILTLRLPIIQ